MSLDGCIAANKMAENLFKRQQKLLPKIDGEFTGGDKVEILVASVRMLMEATYTSLSGDNEKMLDNLIHGTEESLYKVLEGMVPKTLN